MDAFLLVKILILLAVASRIVWIVGHREQ